MPKKLVSLTRPMKDGGPVLNGKKNKEIKKIHITKVFKVRNQNSVLNTKPRKSNLL